ncbi:hypothetical protein E8E12_004364 [Didymella heteroderae]|uniref:Uncharacterized protein n=1 Tax=Didymella heteroderae TaxID=1769908 RepID=A0A9P4WQE8_9PLEO|nr:hypothetical protein E8E12_004364 [Didymella heteroderae]
MQILSTDGTLQGGNIDDATIDAQLRILDETFRPVGFSFNLKETVRTVNEQWYYDLKVATPVENEVSLALRKGGNATLNIYMMGGLNTSTQAWATVPNELQGREAYDGVFQNGTGFLGGSDPWFGLYHTFGNGCEQSYDFVADTPVEDQPFGLGGCEIGRDSCPDQPGLDLIHKYLLAYDVTQADQGFDQTDNYMSYSDDDCRNSWTPGQIQRMREQMAKFRAVRSTKKGEDAKKHIEETTGVKNVVEVWQLDMSSYKSVLDFAARAEKKLERLDVALLSAGISAGKFEIFEQDESTITVNVVSTFLLALALLPKLKATSARFNTRPNLTVVASDVHFVTQFKEKDVPEGQIFAKLSEPTNDMQERYFVSKMMEVLVVRAWADRKPASQIPVTINFVNPGYCKSALTREANFAMKMAQAVLNPIFARTTEQGSRTLVHAASAGPESHGQYMSNCRVAAVAPLVTSSVGYRTQNRVWEELSQKLEGIKPGITSIL